MSPLNKFSWLDSEACECVSYDIQLMLMLSMDYRSGIITR